MKKEYIYVLDRCFGGTHSFFKYCQAFFSKEAKMGIKKIRNTKMMTYTILNNLASSSYVCKICNWFLFFKHTK